MNVTSDIVFNKLKNLKSSKLQAAGLDSKHPRVHKQAAAQLSDKVIIMAGPVFSHVIFNFKVAKFASNLPQSSNP